MTLSHCQTIHVWWFSLICGALSHTKRIVPSGTMSTKLFIYIPVAPTKLIYMHTKSDPVRAGSSIVWRNIQKTACACWSVPHITVWCFFFFFSLHHFK